MSFEKPTTHARAVRSVCGGVLFAMAFLYLIVYIPEIVSGEHSVDFNLLRGLAVIGLAVIGFGAWENRGVM